MSYQQVSSTLISPPLLAALAKNWWLFLIRGITAVAFGVLAFAWPGITLAILVQFYGAFVIVDGVFALATALAGRDSIAPRWWIGVAGLIGIAAGTFTIIWPATAAVIFLLFIAGWSIAIGMCLIIGAIRLRNEIDNEWFLVLSGALSVLFGVALVLMPEAGALAFLWVIALYAILFGVLTVAFALRLQKHR